jgi:hypothetical protein
MKNSPQSTELEVREMIEATSIGSWLQPAVIGGLSLLVRGLTGSDRHDVTYHCRFVARTSSDNCFAQKNHNFSYEIR